MNGGTGQTRALYRAGRSVYGDGMRRTSWLAVLVWMGACGPKVADTEGDETATGSTGDSAGATDGGSSEGATGGGSTGGGSTGGDVCEALADVEPAPAVAVTLRNAGAEPVFVQYASGCDYVDLIAIAGPDADTPVQWNKGSCSFTCSEIATGFCGCPGFCAQDSVLMLAPGGTYGLTWSGGIYVPTEAPAACVGEGLCGTQCLQLLQAPGGTYSFTSIGGAAVSDCFDPNMCTCTPNAEGWCTINALGVGGAARAGSGKLMYPGAAVEVVF